MRLALFLAIIALASFAAPAFAGVIMPDPAHCSVPDRIVLVGGDEIAFPFTVTVRDYNGLWIGNSMVAVSFADCPYVRICSSQPDPRVGLVDCSMRLVGGLTSFSSHGVARFTVVGAATPDACPSDPPDCASVYADGVFLRKVNVAVMDLDGVPGLGGGDLADLLGAVLCGSTSPRLDYDDNGFVDGDDVSVWLAAFFSGRSASGCSSAPCR